jgi:uncharacterized protein YkwD
MGTRAVQGLVAVACAALLAVAAAPTASPSATHSSASMAALESGLIAQVNAIRVHHGLVPLHASVALDAAADAHSREMGADGYFDHPSADGTAFWTRVSHWYTQSGFGTWSVGENLLWYSPNVGASEAVSAWMHSAEHRANILNPRWREIGIGAVHFTSASGPYRDLPVTIVTADFGVRR